MSSRGTGVMRVARSVANGEGDWAEIPSAVRDAIVLAITQCSVAPLRSLDNSRIKDNTGGSPARLNPAALTQANPSPLHLSSSLSSTVLTESNVQSSIQTFEDAAWVRDEAVRSYAEFHNNIESLHAAMRTQLHPVWKTAMQLRPDLLADVRSHYNLSRADEIPDGIPINPAMAQRIAQQAMILDEVEDTLQMLRNTSVRFAAHFLSDEEKISMGANPAYLRAPDIDREVVESRGQSVTLSSTRAAVDAAAVNASPSPEQHEQQLSRRSCHSLSHTTNRMDDGLVDSKPRSRGSHRLAHTSTAAAVGDAAALPHDGSVPSHGRHSTDNNGHITRHHRSRRHHDDDDRCRSSTNNAAAATVGSSADPLLEELRKQYKQRVKELEGRHRRVLPVERQGTWPQVGSVTSSCSSGSTSSRSG